MFVWNVYLCFVLLFIMSSTNNILPSIERLKGRENYASWKFAMQAFLQLDELWEVVSGEKTDESKDKKAL